MERKSASKFPGHQHFEDVGCHVERKTYPENNDPLLEGVFACKRGCGSQPEQEHIGIKCIDEEARRKNFRHVSFSEFDYRSIGTLQLDLFEKDIKDAQGDKKQAANYPEHFAILHQARYKFRKGIADYNQEDVAEPYTRNKTESAFLSVVQALFDDREDHWPNGNGKNKSEGKSANNGLPHAYRGYARQDTKFTLTRNPVKS
jgi:hypothetical protein